MRAGPGLPIGICRPIATFALPCIARAAMRSDSTVGSWEILTTCRAEGRLRGSSHGLACVGAALCDCLVGCILVGLVTAGVGDALVQGVD